MEEYYVGVIVGLICGLLIGLIIGMIVVGKVASESTEQLGQSICEEEYGMDFESYIDNTLKCKPFLESYVGIKVEVPKGIEND